MKTPKIMLKKGTLVQDRRLEDELCKKCGKTFRSNDILVRQMDWMLHVILKTPTSIQAKTDTDLIRLANT